MNILVIGSGGREHAIVWKFRQSRDVREIFCVPGNGGIGADARLLPACAEGDWASYAELARQHKIDLTFVGPEVLWRGHCGLLPGKGLKDRGPGPPQRRSWSAARRSPRQFMRKSRHPTADFEVFRGPREALDYCRARFKAGVSLVVKADGLARARASTVCDTLEDAEARSAA